MDSAESPPYHVEIESSAAKQILHFQRQDQERVMRVILDLANEPRPYNCTKLVGTEAYRIRVGNLRIVYAVDDGEMREVTVTRVAHRREVYK